MLDFPRWKVLTILGICSLFVLLALPNLFLKNGETPPPLIDNRAAWGDHTYIAYPSFLPSKTVSLGLDLQGGSYLLLELDFDRYLHDQMAGVVDSLRANLIAKKVMYSGLNASTDHVSLALLKKDESKDILKDVVSKTDPDLELHDLGDGKYEVAFSSNALQTRKLQLLDQSMQIVNRRVNETGTREPIIQRQGDNRIVLQVPGLQDPERLKALLGKTAKMTFHLVDESANISDVLQGHAPLGSRIIYSDQKDERIGKPFPYAVKSHVELDGAMLVDAAATFDNQSNRPVVSFRFNTLGAERFGEITRDNVGKRFAIVLDDKVITAPRIQTAILGGSGIITGDFTTESANDLAVLLRSGALPAPLKVIEERSVGPSLGADSIEAGKRASLLGVVLVMGFMLINYGLFGIFANVALLVNLIFIMGALSLLQATLTLPGIAGMVLTLGMAVDANVLIYERIREEIRNGRTPFAAIDNGFRAARRTIFDANVTTLIASLCLYYFGTGSVKGFAVTLAIGIVASMFTAILLTRLMVAQWLRRTRPKVIPI